MAEIFSDEDTTRLFQLVLCFSEVLFSTWGIFQIKMVTNITI